MGLDMEQAEKFAAEDNSGECKKAAHDFLYTKSIELPNKSKVTPAEWLFAEVLFFRQNIGTEADSLQIQFENNISNDKDKLRGVYGFTFLRAETNKINIESIYDGLTRSSPRTWRHYFAFRKAAHNLPVATELPIILGRKEIGQIDKALEPIEKIMAPYEKYSAEEIKKKFPKKTSWLFDIGASMSLKHMISFCDFKSLSYYMEREKVKKILNDEMDFRLDHINNSSYLFLMNMEYIIKFGYHNPHFLSGDKSDFFGMVTQPYRFLQQTLSTHKKYDKKVLPTLAVLEKILAKLDEINALTPEYKIDKSKAN
tara:strand:+ start:622 stop:1557 length:936 start_codon:yes stop_codon:yes gene_type:complete